MMTTLTLRLFIASLLVLAFTSGPGYADEASCQMPEVKAEDDCYKNELEQCKNEGKPAAAAACQGSQAAMAANKESMQGGSRSVGTTLGTSADKFKGAVQKCEDFKSKCEQLCKKNNAVDKCKAGFKSVQDAFMGASQGLGVQSAALMDRADSTSGNAKDQQTNATNTTAGDKSNGMGDMAKSAMPALGPVAALAMAAAKKQDEEDKAAAEAEAKAIASSMAVQGNSLFCDKADSGLYVGCNSYLEAACTQTLQNRTFATSATCTGFATRYCTGGDGTPDPVSPSTTVATGTVPTLGISGGGMKTAFCANASAYNFCSAGASPKCPSCQKLANLTSLSCQTSGAACLAQSSDAALANSPAECAGDPLLQASATAIAANGSAPIVGGAATSTDVLSQISDPNASGVQVASVKAKSIIGRSTASASSAGPTSDISGEFGPSLTNITAQAIAKRCQVDHLDNCP